MLFIILSSVFFLAAQCQDPTKVCIPDYFQIHMLSSHRNVSGLIAYDFLQKIVASRPGDGIRSVINLTDFTVAVINETDGVCLKLPSDPNLASLVSQCLPASAKLVSDPNTFVGLNTDTLNILGWEYDVPNYGTVRIAQTRSTPSVPVISQLISSSAIIPSDINLFTNAKATVDDPTIFSIPSSCPPILSVA